VTWKGNLAAWVPGTRHDDLPAEGGRTIDMSARPDYRQPRQTAVEGRATR